MPRKPRQTALDPLAQLTAKPAPITKEEGEAARKALAGFGRVGTLLGIKVAQSDPTRDRTGPQYKVNRAGRRVFVAHGNPNDLYGRW